MKSITNWTYYNNPPSEGIFEHYFGFVYLITNTVTFQKYIGKKIFKNTLRKKVKGRKNRKIVIKESDWRTYKSSSKEVHDDIEKYGEENFKFEVLKYCESKADWSYTEVKEQFKRDVLTKMLPGAIFEYYNSNIGGKYYRTKEIL